MLYKGFKNTLTAYTITAANTDDATSLGCPGSLVEPTKLWCSLYSMGRHISSGPVEE